MLHPGGVRKHIIRTISRFLKKPRTQDSPCFLGVFSQALRLLLTLLHSWTMFRQPRFNFFFSPEVFFTQRGKGSHLICQASNELDSLSQQWDKDSRAQQAGQIKYVWINLFIPASREFGSGAPWSTVGSSGLLAWSHFFLLF